MSGFGTMIFHCKMFLEYLKSFIRNNSYLNESSFRINRKLNGIVRDRASSMPLLRRFVVSHWLKLIVGQVNSPWIFRITKGTINKDLYQISFILGRNKKPLLYGPYFMVYTELGQNHSLSLICVYPESNLVFLWNT